MRTQAPMPRLSAPGSRPSSPGTPPPYVVSPRTRQAIENLSASDPPAERAAPPSRPLIGVVADVEALRVFARYCFATDYQVVTASTLSELALQTEGLALRLVCIDLYTLEHQSEDDLSLLTQRFEELPLLILSQERKARASALRAGRTCTVIALPAALADIRRLAAALIETQPPTGEVQD